jgi:hypothetical protein
MGLLSGRVSSKRTQAQGDEVSEDHQRACVVHSKPAEARHGLLCVAHFDRLADMLRQVEEEAAILSAVPSMAIRTGSGGGSLASTRAPARLDVLVHRDTRRGTGKSETEDDELAAGKTLPVLDVLHSWARVVREERGFTSQAAVTISGERDVLTRALDWIAEQPWIDEMYVEVRQLVGQLKAANGTQDEKPVGRCYLPNEAGICDGPIWIDTAMGHAHCGRCQQTWTGAQLLLLSEQMELDRIERARPKTEDGRRMLTAEEMCTHLGIRLGAFRVRAHRMRIVSIDGHYDPELFSVKDVA